MLKNLLHTFKVTSKRSIQKKTEATGDFIGNKIADRITKVSKTSPQNNLETDEEEILREIYLQNKDRKLLMI